MWAPFWAHKCNAGIKKYSKQLIWYDTNISVASYLRVVM